MNLPANASNPFPFPHSKGDALAATRKDETPCHVIELEHIHATQHARAARNLPRRKPLIRECVLTDNSPETLARVGSDRLIAACVLNKGKKADIPFPIVPAHGQLGHSLGHTLCASWSVTAATLTRRTPAILLPGHTCTSTSASSGRCNKNMPRTTCGATG